MYRLLRVFVRILHRNTELIVRTKVQMCTYLDFVKSIFSTVGCNTTSQARETRDEAADKQTNHPCYHTARSTNNTRTHSSTTCSTYGTYHGTEGRARVVFGTHTSTKHACSSSTFITTSSFESPPTHPQPQTRTHLYFSRGWFGRSIRCCWRWSAFCCLLFSCGVRGWLVLA